MTTTFLRSHKNKDYSIIDNTFIKDKRLSAKAKGIFVYFLMLPEEWEINLSEVQEHFTDGRDSFNAGIKELKDLGYFKSNSLRDSGGKYSKVDYMIIEKPEVDLPKTDLPYTDNPTLINTNNNNTNNISKDILLDTEPRIKKISRIKKKNIVNTISLPSRKEIYSFMGDTNAVKKICDILEETNLQQSFSLVEIKELYDWMVEFFKEKYAGKFYIDKDGNVIGAEIVYNELDKFISFYSENRDNEIKNLKARIRKWIIVSTQPFTPNKK